MGRHEGTRGSIPAQETWYAHIGASLLDPRATVRYIGRYTKRAVLAEYRITFYDGEVIRFAF
ncbi:MAG TPA: transposase, partial [Thermoanaerobaculia bacterium]